MKIKSRKSEREEDNTKKWKIGIEWTEITSKGTVCRLIWTTVITQRKVLD
jgi:hypothetical protein